MPTDQWPWLLLLASLSACGASEPASRRTSAGPAEATLTEGAEADPAPTEDGGTGALDAMAQSVVPPAPSDVDGSEATEASVEPSAPPPTLLERVAAQVEASAAAEADPRPTRVPPDHSEGAMGRQVVREAIRRHFEPLFACVEAARRRHGSIALGDARAVATRHEDGALSYALEGSTGDARFDRRLRRALPEVGLPPPSEGGSTTVLYPFLFQQGDAAGTTSAVQLEEGTGSSE